jgi:hypothetical protein
MMVGRKEDERSTGGGLFGIPTSAVFRCVTQKGRPKDLFFFSGQERAHGSERCRDSKGCPPACFPPTRVETRNRLALFSLAPQLLFCTLHLPIERPAGPKPSFSA